MSHDWKIAIGALIVGGAVLWIITKANGVDPLQQQIRTQVRSTTDTLANVMNSLTDPALFRPV